MNNVTELDTLPRSTKRLTEDFPLTCTRWEGAEALPLWFTTDGKRNR